MYKTIKHVLYNTSEHTAESVKEGGSNLLNDFDGICGTA